jgi:hypothetical protein
MEQITTCQQLQREDRMTMASLSRQETACRAA